MSEMNRVQRWRQQQRAAGKDALTIWLPRELKLYVEDMALKRHCSPSDLVEQALTTCYPLSADVTDTVTDTHVTDMSQIRLMLQQELRAFLGDIHLSQGIAPAQPVTDTVTDTSVQAEAVRAAIEIPYVTDTVTDTAAQTEDERVAIRALQAVTDTITDTGSASTGKRKAPSRQRAATDTVSATDTPQSSARRRKRQAAPTD
jgi:predicted RNA-binding Zn ribbon-like protein